VYITSGLVGNMNCKHLRLGRRRPWSSSRLYSDISLHEVKNNEQETVKITCISTEIRTGNLPNGSLELSLIVQSADLNKDRFMISISSYILLIYFLKFSVPSASLYLNKYLLYICEFAVI
jgi:hypothetical protein